MQSRQVNFRLPLSICDRLEAASAVLGHTQAKIIADAVALYLDNLPGAKRRVIEEVISIRQKP